MLYRFLRILEIDYWEICNLGWVGYFRFIRDWFYYLTGVSSYRPQFFAYGEVDRDLDIDLNEPTEESIAKGRKCLNKLKRD